MKLPDKCLCAQFSSL